MRKIKIKVYASVFDNKNKNNEKKWIKTIADTVQWVADKFLNSLTHSSRSQREPASICVRMYVYVWVYVQCMWTSSMHVDYTK